MNIDRILFSYEMRPDDDFFRKKIVKRGDIDNIKRQQRLLAQPLQDFDSVIIIFAETEDMQRHVPVVHLKLNVT